MNFKKTNIKDLTKGATLIELIAVISIVVLFSMILVADFPEIQRNLALSRATYKLAQDLRKIEDLALSGVKATDSSGELITTAKGYGIYFDFNQSQLAQYIIYADVDSSRKYNSQTSRVIEIVDVSEVNPSLYIKQAIPAPTPEADVSINFSPPNPTVNISNLADGSYEIGIVLGTKTSSFARTVLVNTSGAISVK